MDTSVNKKRAVSLIIFLAFVFFGLTVRTEAAVGDLVRITDDTRVSTTESVGMSWAKQASVAFLENDTYVVVWDDWCNSANDCPNDDGAIGILFQLFSQAGEKIGGAVETGLSNDNQDYAVGVARVGNGFVIAARDDYRIFDMDGSPLTEVLVYSGSIERDWFAIRSDVGGGFAVAYRGGGGISYLDTYTNLGVSTGSVALTDQAQFNPGLITLQDGSGYLAIWPQNSEIYGQFVSASLELSGVPFRIDQASSPMIQSSSPIELVQNGNGDILVSWYDARAQQNNSLSDKIYARLMDSAGAFLTDEFVIASDLIEPSFIGQPGGNLHPYIPPAMAVLDDKFVVAWIEKDGVDQLNMATHIKGRIVDGQGYPEGEIFKMETNEFTVNPTRRALFPVLASNGTDNFALTWFDGRNSYVTEGNSQDSGTEIMANFWETEGEPVTQAEARKAKIYSWKYSLSLDQTSCPVKLRLDIRGRRFDDDAEVKIGSKEASSVDVRSSKKIVAKFCLSRLMKNYQSGSKKTISVENPDADTEKADKKMNLDLIVLGELNPNTLEGVKNIQRSLVRLKRLSAKDVTGVYDTLTIQAVKQFQKDNGILQTGYVGPLTKEAFEKI